MYLQRFLNLVPSTVVSLDGAGSNSQLTNYFGLKTKDAVMRFQALHSDEVLTPAGLTTPSGFVGEFTRRKMNAMLIANPDVPVSLTANTQNNTNGNGQTGANLNATAYAGTNYAANNVPSYVQNLFPPNTTTAPQWWQEALAAQTGMQQITDYTPQVGNASSTQNFPKPELTGVSPRIVTAPDQIITLTGMNFEAHTTLFGNLGTAAVTSLDGTTITFALRDFTDYESSRAYYSSTTQDIFFQVANSAFASDNVAIVTYSFPFYASTTATQHASGSDISTSQSGSLTNGIIALGTAVGAGLLVGALAKAFSSGAAAAVGGAAGSAAGGAAAGSAASAAGALLLRPFGGIILFMNPCFDSPNIVIYMLNYAGIVPLPIRLMYIPVVSKLYLNFIFHPGSRVLGNYVIGGWCTGGGGIVNGIIRQMGTSL
jgi:hypothetical protein